MRHRSACAAVLAALATASSSALASPGVGGHTFNYAEAIQKSIYFYEAQQSGRLSPNNRVAWRGPACLSDGADIGKDLSGGWFDAGDHWTANLTMSWAALCLAMSADFYPQAWRSSGQMSRLLEELLYVNDYLARCVLNPDVADPLDLDVCIGCGGLGGVPRITRAGTAQRRSGARRPSTGECQGACLDVERVCDSIGRHRPVDPASAGTPAQKQKPTRARAHPTRSRLQPVAPRRPTTRPGRSGPARWTDRNGAAGASATR